MRLPRKTIKVTPVKKIEVILVYLAKNTEEYHSNFNSRILVLDTDTLIIHRKLLEFILFLANLKKNA